MIILLLGEKLTCDQVLTKDSVTVSVDAVVYYRCNFVIRPSLISQHVMVMMLLPDGTVDYQPYHHLCHHYRNFPAECQTQRSAWRMLRIAITRRDFLPK